jgi:hypothetical protein
VLAQPPGAGLQRRGALGRRGACPFGLRRAGGADGGIGGLGRARGDAPDHLSGGRIEHVERADGAGVLGLIQDCHRLRATRPHRMLNVARRG